MTISSLDFLGFCIASILLFLVFPKKKRWISLLISSIAFYWISANTMIIYILLTSLTTWLGSRKLDQIRIEGDQLIKNAADKAEKKALRTQVATKRRHVLQLVLLLNVGALVAFKVLNCFKGLLTFLAGIFMGGQGDASAFTLILPLGISYYTFATVGYLLDIYWKRYESEENFARFFLFAIYFPHILQGPISRYPRLGQELKKEVLCFRWDNFVMGMESILLGLFKKLVIADRAAIFVSNTLMTEKLGGSIYIIAMILDAIQIYSDFSGYMDIVSGISMMFDVELEQNFNHPFLSKSVPEFWRRWHMTLGGWFKDYVYYPISVSKTVKNLNKKTKNWKEPHARNLAIVILPVMITWLLTGLWHGTGIGYVMWGIYYGVLITISVTFSDDIQKILAKLKVNTECFSYRLFQTLKIFCIFMGGRFLGSTMSMHQRKVIVKAVLRKLPDFNIYKYGLDHSNFAILIWGVALLVAIAVIETKENIFVWLNKQNKIFTGLVIIVMFFAIFLLGIYGAGYDTSGFMYQQF